MVGSEADMERLFEEDSHIGDNVVLVRQMACCNVTIENGKEADSGSFLAMRGGYIGWQSCRAMHLSEGIAVVR